MSGLRVDRLSGDLDLDTRIARALQSLRASRASVNSVVKVLRGTAPRDVVATIAADDLDSVSETLRLAIDLLEGNPR